MLSRVAVAVDHRSSDKASRQRPHVLCGRKPSFTCAVQSMQSSVNAAYKRLHESTFWLPGLQEW